MDMLNLLTETKKNGKNEFVLEIYGYDVKLDKKIYDKITKEGIKFYPRIKRGLPYFYNSALGYLHRWVMKEEGHELDSNDMVDHIDGKTTNNMKDNLRVTDRSQNAHNIKRYNIYFHKGNGKWCAEIVNQGHKRTIGYFNSRKAAKDAYIQAARETRGEYHPFGEKDEIE
jgi:hypothetical protein